MLPVIKSDHQLVKTRRNSTPTNMKPKSSSFLDPRPPRISISETKRQKSMSVSLHGSSGIRGTLIENNGKNRTHKFSCQMEMKPVIRARTPSVSAATSLPSASPAIVLEPAFEGNQEENRSRSSSRKLSMSVSPRALANLWMMVNRKNSCPSSSPPSFYFSPEDRGM